MLPSKPDDTAVGEQSVFPLPLTPFELYYFLDDSPEYPTAFPIEACFAGTLSRELFCAALEATVARHPLVRARVEAQGAQLKWVADEHSRPLVDWADESVPIAHPAGEHIDLTAGGGLRVWVRTSPGRARAWFQFHHACCDGLAGLRFVGEVLTAYKAGTGDAEARQALRPLDPALLQGRGEVLADGGVRRSLLTALPDLFVTAWFWSSLLLRAPAVLAEPERRGSTGTTPPRDVMGYENETLNRDETARLHALGKRLAVTANDLLIRDYLLTLGEWNRQHGGDTRRAMRINVPVSVRRRSEAAMPAANRIGFGFITAAGRGDPGRLLKKVRGQTRRIKSWMLGLFFLGGLEMASRRPRLFHWALGRQESFATAVLSNVGKFTVAGDPREGGDQRWTCGDLELVRITGMPPIRKLTRAAVLVLEYAGEITLSLRCDPRFFGVEQTRELLGQFAERVRQTLERGN